MPNIRADPRVASYDPAQDQADEEARERYVAEISLKLLWTVLTILVLAGVLVPLTLLFGWLKFYLPSLLGILCGAALTAGFSSLPRLRVLTALLLGALTLPGLSLYLSLMAERGDQALESASAALLPFVANTLIVLSGGFVIVGVWRRRPVLETGEAHEKEVHRAMREGKRRSIHEGSDRHEAA